MKRPRRNGRIASTVDALAAQARNAAEATPNPFTELSSRIRTTMDGDADPYVLAGVLLEGIVQVLTTQIPPERRAAAELATLLMLKQRLASAPSLCCL